MCHGYYQGRDGEMTKKKRITPHVMYHRCEVGVGGEGAAGSQKKEHFRRRDQQYLPKPELITHSRVQPQLSPMVTTDPAPSFPMGPTPLLRPAINSWGRGRVGQCSVRDMKIC